MMWVVTFVTLWGNDVGCNISDVRGNDVACNMEDISANDVVCNTNDIRRNHVGCIINHSPPLRRTLAVAQWRSPHHCLSIVVVLALVHVLLGLCGSERPVEPVHVPNKPYGFCGRNAPYLLTFRVERAVEQLTLSSPPPPPHPRP